MAKFLEHYETPTTAAEEIEAAKLFDVVVKKVVGSVYAGGDIHPHIAAFQIIGEATMDQDGEFSFPDSTGITVTVTIRREK
jgi:hypothetical protein